MYRRSLVGTYEQPVQLLHFNIGWERTYEHYISTFTHFPKLRVFASFQPLTMGDALASIFFLICVSIVIRPIWGQEVLNTGITLSLNSILYFLPGKPFSSGYASIYTTCASRSKTSTLGLVPVTILNSTVNLESIDSVVDAFGEEDDVWGVGFLSGNHLTIGADCSLSVVGGSGIDNQ